jgi:hypothetical protein
MLSLDWKNELDPVAVYGALVASAVAAWQFYTWWKSGPRLVGKARSGFVEYGGERDPNEKHIYITVDNRGTETTTITGVGLVGYKTFWEFLRNRPSFGAFIKHAFPGYPIPGKLNVGADFRSKCNQTAEIETISRSHRTYVTVYHTFSDRPTYLRLSPIKEKKADDPP